MQVTVGENELIPYPFVIATSDTREVYRKFYYYTMEFDEEIIDKRDDSFDKIIRISNNVLLSAGGTSEVSEPLKDFIQEKAKKHYFLDDFIPVLEKAHEYLKNTDDYIIKHLFDSGFYELTLSGFFKNGSPGKLHLVPTHFRESFGIEGNIYKTDGFATSMFSPSEDITKRKNELMDFSNSPFIKEPVNLIDLIIQHLIGVHALIASQETERVSPICIVHLLQNINGKMNYEKHRFDLREKVKEFHEVPIYPPSP